MKSLRKTRHMRVLLVAALAAAGALFTAVPSAAITTEHDHSSTYPQPPDEAYFYCGHSPNDYATGCFAPLGDWFELVDDEPDGYSVVLQWWVMSADEQSRVREGNIWNSEGYLYYTWQNKDLPENRQLYWRVCRGSHATHTIHYWSCSEKAASGT